jgi:hypothetical protein
MDHVELTRSDAVCIEIGGTLHEIHGVEDTCEALILVVDTDQEEREMR